MNGRTILVSLTLGIVAAGWQPVQAAPVCGDCNGDGIVSILDALTAAQHAVAIITLVPPAFERCDVNPEYGDGQVSITDSLRLAQFAVAVLPTLYCTSPISPGAVVIENVDSPACIGRGQTGIAVSVDVINTRPYLVDVSAASLIMTAPGAADVSSEYSAMIAPGSPTSILAGETARLTLTVDANLSLTGGPIIVDAAVSVFEPFTGASYSDSGADTTGSWIIADQYFDFESGPAGWSATQDWELGDPTSLIPSKSGPNMWGTVLTGAYTAQGTVANPTGRSTLTSPVIDLGTNVLPYIEVTMLCDFEAPDWDGGNLKASTDGGATFPIVLQPVLPSYDGVLAGGLSTNPLAGQVAFLGSHGRVYERPLFDATALGGLQIVLRFDFGADSFVTTDWGWYIDDVLICDQSRLLPGRATNPIPPHLSTGIVADPAGIMMSWGAARLATSYSVYLDTVSPPVTLLATGLASTNVISPALATSTTYYWRVDSTNSVGTTPGAIWNFTTGTYAGVPGILINEIYVGVDDWVELVNKSATTYDLTGWTLEFHGGGNLNGTYYFPVGVILDPGGYLVVGENEEDGAFYFDTNFDIAWTSLATGETILRTDTGLGIDYFAHNTGSFPSLPGDLSFSVTSPLSLAGFTGAQRLTFSDTDTENDWDQDNSESGRQINNFQLAILPPPRPFPRSPKDGFVGVFPSLLGNFLAWDLNGEHQSFDVYFDVVNPPMTLVSSAQSQRTWLTPAIARGSTRYWQVRARNAAAETLGPVWSFTTSASVQPPRVLINEVSTKSPQYIEFYNAEPTTVDISRWQVTTYNSSVGVADGTYLFSYGTLLAPGGMTVVQDFGVLPPGGHHTDFNISFTDTSAGQVWLQAEAGEGVDYVAFNTLSFTQLPFDLSFTATAPLNIVGSGVAARVDFTDTDDVSDWQAESVETPSYENPLQPLGSPPHRPSSPQPDTGSSGVLARGTGHRLSWVPAAGTSQSFLVFFGASYPPTQFIGNSTEPTILSPPLLPNQTYFWKVNAVNSIGQTPGEIWVFTTSGVGSAPVIVNEIYTGSNDWVELLNVSTGSVPLGGWKIEFFDDGVLGGTFTIPVGTTLLAGDMLLVAESPLGAALITPFSIPWRQFGGTPECVLKNPANVVLDYMFTTAAGGGDPPSARPPQAVFHLDSTPSHSIGMPGMARTSRTDTDRGSDWMISSGTPGTLNPGQ